MRTWFHKLRAAKHRGGILPGCLRVGSRRGVSLVELLIAVLILTIVCLAWLQIIGLQSARREARRREAIERLSGMMDAFMHMTATDTSLSEGDYYMEMSQGGMLSFRTTSNKQEARPLFDNAVSPIGYRLRLLKKNDLPHGNLFGDWNLLFTIRGLKNLWLVGELYDQSGVLSDSDKPFFSVPVCLGH